MKKIKGLSRTFLGSYLSWLFGAVLCGLLFVKMGGALPIIAFVLIGLDLAAIIVARCMFKSHYSTFFTLSIVGFGFLNLFGIGAFVTEAIYTSQGIPSTYAWVIASINLVVLALIDWGFITGVQKIHHKRLVEEGLIVEKEEEI